MIVDFDTLPNESRIWIFQSNKILTQSEQDYVNERVDEFLTAWTAHGKNLQGGFTIKEGLFLILGLNEEVGSATGCSIDKSVTVFKDIESFLNISLFDRTSIALAEGSSVHLVSLSKLKKRIEQDEINHNQLFFNNTIEKKGDLISKWKISLGNSWLGRYFVHKEPI